MNITIKMGCGHLVEVSSKLPKDQIHYLQHLGMCLKCSEENQKVSPQ